MNELVHGKANSMTGVIVQFGYFIIESLYFLFWLSIVAKDTIQIMIPYAEYHVIPVSDT